MTPAPEGPGAGPAGGGKKRPGPALWISLGAAALVVLLVAGAVIGEFATRGNVADGLAAKADAVEIAFGGETVEGGYGVTVDGASYLLQHLGGTYEHIAFDGADQSHDGAPFTSSFHAYGVPADLSGQAERIEYAMHLPAEAVLAWLLERDFADDETYWEDFEIELGDGGMTLRDRSLESIDIVIVYEYELRLDGSDVVLELISDSWVFGDGEEPLEWGGDDPQRVELCTNAGAVDAAATEASVTPDGVALAWTATGSDATLDNLSGIANCLSVAE